MVSIAYALRRIKNDLAKFLKPDFIEHLVRMVMLEAARRQVVAPSESALSMRCAGAPMLRRTTRSPRSPSILIAPVVRNPG